MANPTPKRPRTRRRSIEMQPFSLSKEEIEKIKNYMPALQNQSNLRNQAALAAKYKAFYQRLPSPGTANPVAGPIEAALFAPVAGTAIKAAGSAMNAPMVVAGKTIPGVTGNNILASGFAANSASDLINPNSDVRKNPNLTNVVTTGLGFAGLPYRSAAISLAGDASSITREANRFGKSIIPKTNKNSKFVSEINWSKWNKDTPKYPELIDEYNAIEESTKKAGTWMKYSDGTPFKGTPEQFVQMNSKNVQKFAGGKQAAEEMYRNPMYRGAKQHIDDFANRDRSDYATFTTKDLKNAKTYAGENSDFFNPAVQPSSSWNKGIYELGIPSNTKKVVGDAKNKNWRLLEWDSKIAQGTKSKDLATSHNQQLQDVVRKGEAKSYNLERYKPGKQYLSTDVYADYVKNTANAESAAEIKNVVDTMGDGFVRPTTVYAVDANRVPIKSLRHNVGFFDKNNPNIYRSVVPLGIGTFVAPKLIAPERKRYRRK